MQHDARASRLLITILFTALVTASCSDSDSDARLLATQPSVVGTSAVVLSATPATAVAQPVIDPVCPSVPPFNVPVGVIVSPNGPFDVTISRIRAQFTDSTGRQAPQVTLPMLPVTLPAPGPTMQFGVASRTFPFAFGVGCGVGTRGTVIIIVEGSDHRGRHFSEQVTVPVQ
jgi:hypothetical protein